MNIKSILGGLLVASTFVAVAWHLPRKRALTGPSTREVKESIGVTPVAPQPFTLTNAVAETLDRDRLGFSITPLPDGGETRQVTLLAPNISGEAGPLGYRLRAAGQGMPMPAGAPDVPTLYRLVPGFRGWRAQIEVDSVDYRDIPAVEVTPVPQTVTSFKDGDQRSQRHAHDESIYSADAFWPPEIVSVEDATLGRDEWTRLAFHPVQYNPRTQTLRYIETVSARIVYKPVSIKKSRKPMPPSPPSPVPDPLDCPPLYPDPILPPMNGQPTDFAVRRAGDVVDAHYKITTSGEGIYQVTGAELGAAGVPPTSIIGSNLRLFSRDREMAIEVSTSGVFGPSDYFRFYQEDYDGRYSGGNVCWLGFGGAGLRMATVDAQPVGGTNIATYLQRETLTQNQSFQSSVSPLNEEWDHWYDTRLLGGFVNFNQSVGVSRLALGQDARICVTLHAGSNSSHNTSVVVNSQTVGSFAWSGTTELNGTAYSNSAVFDSSTLSTTGGAPVPIEVSQSPLPDIAYLEDVTLLYPRELFAWNTGRISFTGEQGAHNYQVEAFPATAVHVLDCTDPWNPVKLTNAAVVQNGNGRQVRFRREAPERPRFVMTADTGLATVDSIVKTMIRGLAETDQQADYIVICPYAFRDQAYRLLTARHLNGESVAVAPIEDIYNEFCYGLEDASAIQQFLGYAFHHWEQPGPQQVVILGDASYDPREFLGSSTANVVPTPLAGTPLTYTGLDVRGALVNSAPGNPDILADLAIGRIPARTSAELEAVVDKILAYEALSPSASFRNRGVLVAGAENDPTDNFDQSAEAIAGIMTTNGFPAANIDRQYPPAATKTSVLNSINNPAGQFVVGYFGPGGPFRWDDGPLLLETSDVPALAVNINHTYPIFTATTCQNGYYLSPQPATDPFSDSLAEVLLLTAGRGGVAIIAGTAPSPPGASDAIANGFYESLLGGTRETLGATMMDAYLHAFGLGATAPELVFYQVFGDPGLIVNP